MQKPSVIVAHRAQGFIKKKMFSWGENADACTHKAVCWLKYSSYNDYK